MQLCKVTYTHTYMNIHKGQWEAMWAVHLAQAMLLRGEEILDIYSPHLQSLLMPGIKPATFESQAQL